MTTYISFANLVEMLLAPFYDPTKSYEDNYDNGPFGDFNDGKIFQQTDEPHFEFLGHKVYLPFGIPAGPLLNSKFAQAAMDKGFDIVVYKTVRTKKHISHQWPNVLSVNVAGDLTLEDGQKGIVGHQNYTEPLSITNSFGVPSYEPEIWQEDISRLVKNTRKGQLVVGSFQGSLNPEHNEKKYFDDYKLAAKLMAETGVKAMEVNLSCPNEGHSNLICYDTDKTVAILNLIKNVIGDIPLVIKISYFYDNEALKNFLEKVAPYIKGVAAVNTLPAKIIDRNGVQALPGNGRELSGICGHAIKWAGLDMVKRMRKIRDENQYNFSIEGVGGVTKSEDYFEYIRSGADSVMSATGAMWNPYLAQEIKESENKAMDIINSWTTT